MIQLLVLLMFAIFLILIMLFITVSDVLGFILENKNLEDSVVGKYRNRADEIINSYLSDKNNDDDDLKNSIQHFFKNKALEENSVILLFDQDDFISTFQNFIIAYSLLNEYANGILSDLLTEFHNSMSNVIVALLNIKGCNTNSNNNVFTRNMDKACGHLKRGIKDAYKIIIKCMYPIIRQNTTILKELKHDFIQIRCDEIDSLFNIEKHEQIEESIKEIALKYLDKLHIEQNKENQKIHKRNCENIEKLKNNIKEFYLYKERI